MIMVEMKLMSMKKIQKISLMAQPNPDLDPAKYVTVDDLTDLFGF